MTSIRNHTSHVSRDSPYGIMDVTSPSVIYRGPQVNGFKSPASGPAPLPKQPSIADKIAEYIKKRKAVSYFLSDFPEAKSQRLFADCKVQIWAVEALSYLVASSYHEDTFGVVQKSLPAILTSMLSLQESVEKCFKLSTGASRRVLRGQNDPDGLRFALKASLRTCLYRVVNKFKDHLSIMQLPPDQTRKLKQFMEYKE
ncbi:nucleoporin NDC1-like [Lingula anatina]|uniref:Nucleoporin NDC1-like n=1 Tax=Lingula anatina TaxID=7574 RepID=A0A1S3JNY1_LINAN|nr:nucleoporin NDC1-like [Lingula anatina]|eukprot:XP_013412057.1 nucleoporin NDC1-like [Lingula anatina]